MSSLLTLTYKLIRERGGEPAKVEFYNHHANKYFDLFGVVDVEALFPDHTLYVQVCRDTDLGDHFTTCMGEPRTIRLLEFAGRKFEIWSWAKKRNRWRARIYHARLHGGKVTFFELAEISTETVLDVQTSARGAR